MLGRPTWLRVGALLLAMAATAVADDWPQWRGPNRDGTSAETGLMKSWPADGPTLARTIGGIGEGISSPMIADGRIYITGKVDGGIRLFCLGLDGARRWAAANGAARGRPSTARCSPTVDGDAVYVPSIGGRLAAFAADSGRERWSVDFVRQFGGRVPRYSYAESVLIIGEKLICQPGGPRASVVALDKKTGKTLWTGQGMNDTVTYCSPILRELHGVRQIVVVTEVGVVGIRETNGRLLWRYDKPYTGARNCLTPICWENFVFAESGHRGASAIVRIERNGEAFAAKPVWESDKLPSHVGGHVGLDGHVYGHDGRAWVCREMKTGKEVFRAREVGNGSTILADGRFYCLSNTGAMSLVEASPKGHKVVGRFRIPNAAPRAWARPAIADGKLYIRNKDKLFAYSIRER